MKAGTNSPFGEGEGEPVGHEEQHSAVLALGGGHELPEDPLRGEVWGGAESDSPNLDRLRAATARGEIQAVFTFEPRRLIMNPLEPSLILDELREAGVAVQFLGDNLADLA